LSFLAAAITLLLVDTARIEEHPQGLLKV